MKKTKKKNKWKKDSENKKESYKKYVVEKLGTIVRDLHGLFETLRWSLQDDLRFTLKRIRKEDFLS